MLKIFNNKEGRILGGLVGGFLFFYFGIIITFSYQINNELI